MRPAGGTATAGRCGGGATIGELCRFLSPRGVRLRQVASLPHVTVAGAMATATHGTGLATPIIADTVAAFDLVTAGGDITTFERGTDSFDAAAVGLGALGVVTSVTLDIVEDVVLDQQVHVGIPLANFRASEEMQGATRASALISFGESPAVCLFRRRELAAGAAADGAAPRGAGAGAGAGGYLGGVLQTEPMVCFESHTGTATTGAGPAKERWYRHTSEWVLFFVSLGGQAPHVLRAHTWALNTCGGPNEIESTIRVLRDSCAAPFSRPWHEQMQYFLDAGRVAYAS